MPFGKQLLEAKEKLRMSFRELSSITRISAGYLSRISSGHAEPQEDKKHQIIEGIGKYVTENNLNIQLSILEGFRPQINQHYNTNIYLEIIKNFDEVNWDPQIVVKTVSFTDKFTENATEYDIIKAFSEVFFTETTEINHIEVTKKELMTVYIPQIVDNITKYSITADMVAGTLAFIQILSYVKPDINNPILQYLEQFMSEFKKKHRWYSEIEWNSKGMKNWPVDLL